MHSPLAFTLVKEVVRPARGVRYYDEELLEPLAASSEEEQFLRLLFRLAARYRFLTAETAVAVPSPVRKTLLLADSRLEIGRGGGHRHLTVADDTLPNAELAERLRTGATLLLRQPSADRQAVCRAMPGGVLLEARGWLLAIPRPGALHAYRL